MMVKCELCAFIKYSEIKMNCISTEIQVLQKSNACLKFFLRVQIDRRAYNFKENI